MSISKTIKVVLSPLFRIPKTPTDLPGRKRAPWSDKEVREGEALHIKEAFISNFQAGDHR